SLRQSKATKETLRRRGDVESSLLVQAVRPALLGNDFSTLEAFFKQLASKEDREVAWAFVAGEDGQVIAHTDATKNTRPVSDPLGRELLDKPAPDGRRYDTQRILGFSRTIDHEGRRQGTVAVGINLAVL